MFHYAQFNSRPGPICLIINGPSGEPPTQLAALARHMFILAGLLIGPPIVLLISFVVSVLSIIFMPVYLTYVFDDFLVCISVLGRIKILFLIMVYPIILVIYMIFIALCLVFGALYLAWMWVLCLLVLPRLAMLKIRNKVRYSDKNKQD